MRRASQGHLFLLKLLPAPLHRLLYRCAHQARRQVWRLRRPSIEGVRVLAFDDAGGLLLVRHSYGSRKWLPPGGGLGRGEEPLLAAMRELVEETGCLLEQARLVAQREEVLHGAINRVHLVVGQAQGLPRPDMREIVEARFFSLDALPAEVPRALAEWIAAGVEGRTAPTSRA